VFVHVPPQSVPPTGQPEQTPIEQVWPSAQRLPHAPQFAASLARTTHAFAQFAVPAGHEGPHAPAAHTWPIGQAAPHVPQLPGSVEVSTQMPPQFVVPTGQPAQTPNAQT
jgi:hypothetical protein